MIGPGRTRILPALGFPVHPTEVRGQDPEALGVPSDLILTLFAHFSSQRRGKAPLPIGVSVPVGTKPNQTPPLSSLGPLQREIRDAPKLRLWPRTEPELLAAWFCDGCSVISGPRRRTEPCPAGCLKVMPTLACWETNSVSLFVGSLCWGRGMGWNNSLGLRLPSSHSCLAVSTTHRLSPIPEPLLVGATARLTFLCVLASFCVFSPKLILMG